MAILWFCLLSLAIMLADLSPCRTPKKKPALGPLKEVHCGFRCVCHRQRTKWAPGFCSSAQGTDRILLLIKLKQHLSALFITNTLSDIQDKNNNK
jgi:hypothetical protein